MYWNLEGTWRDHTPTKHEIPVFRKLLVHFMISEVIMACKKLYQVTALQLGFFPSGYIK